MGERIEVPQKVQKALTPFDLKRPLAKTKEDLKAAQLKWYQENSTGGMVGRTPNSENPSTAAELRDNSENIFKKNNVVKLERGQ